MKGTPRLAQHPNGVVALWGRGQFGGSFAVSRLNGSWEAEKVYGAPIEYVTYDVAASAAGETLVTAQVSTGNKDEIYAGTASGAAPLPDLTTRISGASNGSTLLNRRRRTPTSPARDRRLHSDPEAQGLRRLDQAQAQGPARLPGQEDRGQERQAARHPDRQEAHQAADAGPPAQARVHALVRDRAQEWEDREGQAALPRLSVGSGG
jgi:hypothetical protein